MLSLFPFFETKSNISWPRPLLHAVFGGAGLSRPSGCRGGGAAVAAARLLFRATLGGATCSPRSWTPGRGRCGRGRASLAPRPLRRGHLIPTFLDDGTEVRLRRSRPRACTALPPAGPVAPPLSGRREGAWAWRARPRAPPPRRPRRGRPLPASLGGEDKDGAAEGGEAVRVAEGGTMRGGKGGECSCLFLVFF